MNVPGLIIGLATAIAAALFPPFAEAETAVAALDVDQRRVWLRLRLRFAGCYSGVRWGFRDPGALLDFSRPFHERELAMAREILLLLCSHQGLFLAGLILTSLSLSGF